MTGEGLVETARRLDREAREHKSAAARHRRLAQEAREKQAVIEARCRELGIAVIYQSGEGDAPWPNQSSTSRR